MSEFNKKIIGERIRYCRIRSDETLGDIGKLLGVNKSTVMRWENGETGKVSSSVLKELAEHFGVSSLWLSGAEADMEMTEKKKASVKIPVLGYVKAGIPIEAVTEILDYEEISPEIASSGDFFALSVKGNSMEPRICEGDIVIVRMQDNVDNGDVAVALVGDNEATVKKFYKSDDGVKLIAFNPMFEPMYFTRDEVNNLPVKVIGKVIELRGRF